MASVGSRVHHSALVSLWRGSIVGARPPATARASLVLLRPYCNCRTAISRNESEAGTEAVVASEQEGFRLSKSSDLVAMEYADLNISDKISEDLGHIRIRQHVNPLSSSLMAPVEVPDWNRVYKDATLPLMVDIGCGSGRFLLWLAKSTPSSRNYLGLEIRQKLVDRAKFWVDELALSNIHFIFANAMVSFNELVCTYPGPLVLVSILCPDPHFKRRYHKRRVVQKPLVESITNSLVPGGQVFIQSDVLEVATDMRHYFEAESDQLVHIDTVDPNILCDTDGWLLNNPMGKRTEREIHAEFEGGRIYRRLYQKKIQASS